MTDSTTRFDAYIWSTHDCNGNGLVELFSEKELADGVNPARYAPIVSSDNGRISEISPFPVETALMASFVYRLKATLAQIAGLLENGEAEKYTEEK